MRTIAAFTACLLTLAAAGCGDSTTSPSTSTPTSPVTETFISVLAYRGSTSRAFVVSTAGTIKVTLATLGNGTATAGLAIGLPATSAPCSPALSLVTGPSGDPQIVTSADAGTYCVQVFDNGSLTADTPFTLTVEHP
ncbi:MAG: hypothetical protein QM736_22890 [Vicinamibacterales bacterium]